MPEDPPSGQASSQDAAADNSPFAAPQITLPKGGGAIRGIGEKFAANPVTGTGSLTVPIAVSPGRSGVGPQVSLSYDSGGNNGPFGMGWSLHSPSIMRKTEKGLPHYRDDDFRGNDRSDVFILSGAEDLVPVLRRGDRGKWVFDVRERDGYRVQRYRPRIEGLFARIECWTRLADGDTHWCSISKDNVLTVYGCDAQSRIADPHDPRCVFGWLICRSFDDKGNAIIYEYAAENDAGVDLTRPGERNRDRTANRYLKRIRYGNRRPLLLDPHTPSFRKSHIASLDLDSAGWMFEVVFDYGGQHYREEPPDHDGRVFAQASLRECEDRSWPVRADPFSSYRSCFEVRTYRLCRRVLMFHHFPDELGCEDYLVRSTAFEYRQKPTGSFITRIIQAGHKREHDGRYLTRSLPPLDLGYTTSPLEDGDYKDYRLCEIDPANLPEGIDNSAYRFIDLDGEGISGVLAEQGGSWFYKHNLGAGRFGKTEIVSASPSARALSGGHQQLLDLAGDGNLDLVQFAAPLPGFFERTLDGGWKGFRSFRHLPLRDWNDANLRFVDVTGDGIADLLITENDAYTWHPSLLKEGFGAGVRVTVPSEQEETGPRAIFADGTQSIYLADMSGDGLSDLVRIRNGEVCYWPNRGYGRFGAKVTMDCSPWFDDVDLFNQRRIRLADTDGSGLTDILYLGRDGVRVYLNQSGNGWSEPRVLRHFPVVDNVSSVTTADLLGHGTACLVWSSPLPADARRPLRYVDLMDGKKPHLLERVKNNFGAETVIEYASSTEFYLADKAAGTPWVTRLAFPVHVVERVETFDYVSRSRLVTRYTYHHGYYDGVEREFRGFGRVDQLDTEAFSDLTASKYFPVGDNMDAAFNLPPVLTKTWFHTGVYLAGGRISRHMAHEYFREGNAIHRSDACADEHDAGAALNDTILPEHIGPEEAREACRALKSAILRREIYALDDTAQSCRPYTVAESNYTIRPLQPRRSNRHAVFFVHPREAITLNYERNIADPRTGHTLTLAVDEYGNVLKSVAIGYRRRSPTFEEQDRTLATVTESSYTNAICEDSAYRVPIPAKVSTYELTAPELSSAKPLSFAKVAAIAACAAEIAYEARPTPGRTQKRCIERLRTLYRKNDLSALLPIGTVESIALAGEDYKLAFTPGVLDLFRGKASRTELVAVMAGRNAGYRDLDGDGSFWVPSGRVFYSPGDHDAASSELAFACEHFFLPHRFRDPFGNDTIVGYDRKHDISVVLTRDAAGNETTAEPDYRALQSKLVTDPNGNRTAMRYDALGMLAGEALLGKAAGPIEGDSFEDFVTDLAPVQINRFFQCPNPYEFAIANLGTATTRIVYDFECVPACTASIARETHVSALPPGRQTRVQLHFLYCDGFGREVQTKMQAEPGPLDLNKTDSPICNPRWVGTGTKIYNNKGKPVRQYEPFFSDNPQFGIERWGVASTIFYDPLQRSVATLHPDHTFEKVVFSPWKQTIFDVNDTVTSNPQTDLDVAQFFDRLPDTDFLPTWYRMRIDGGKGPHEKVAAEKAARHADTPTVVHFDSLARTFLTVVDNGKDAGGHDQKYRTRIVLDIEGNQRDAIDAFDRVVMHSDYDLLRRRIHQASMDAGQRWILNDVSGKPIRAWNSRHYAFRVEYDELRRPLRSFVKGGDPSGPPDQIFPHEILFERPVYGDSPDAGLTEWQQKQANLRGKVFRHCDAAGVVITDLYDFKGNSLRSARVFTRDYKNPPDWSNPPELDREVFVSTTAYDALNRAIAVTTPDGSIYRPTFNDANLLERVDVNVRNTRSDGQPAWTPFVAHVNYDAKGQRTVIRYGNGCETKYHYDDKTFRLIHLKTTRRDGRSSLAAQIFGDSVTVQDLGYTYDPIGNITRIEDASLKVVFNSNQRVNPAGDYTYDPLYRLIEASGRENVAQSPFAFAPPDGDYRDYPFVGAAQMHDPQSLRNYREQYEYDPIGNLQKMFHHAAKGNWTRSYSYDERSLLEPDRTNNRLSQTTLGASGLVSGVYHYDVHGNMIRMPHLPIMQWNFKDELSATARQMVDGQAPETTYYVYDSGGRRTRKVTARRNGKLKNERLYLGGFEIFREYGADGTVTLSRETLHVMDDRRRIALVETDTVDEKKIVVCPAHVERYQLTNHLESATLELDESGELISYEEYSAYGDTTYQARRTVAEVSLKRYRYAGKERDSENGFTYHGARYYAPWLGRWTSCDPAGLAKSPNLYEYVNSRPLALIDKSGLEGSHWIDIPLLDDLARAIDQKMNIAARDNANQPQKADVSIPLEAAKEVITSADELANKSPVAGAVASGKAWQDEFVAAVVTPNSSEATVHGIKAVSAAMKFTVFAIRATGKAPKSPGQGESGTGPVVPPMQMGPGSQTPADPPPSAPDPAATGGAPQAPATPGTATPGPATPAPTAPASGSPGPATPGPATSGPAAPAPTTSGHPAPGPGAAGSGTPTAPKKKSGTTSAGLHRSNSRNPTTWRFYRDVWDENGEGDILSKTNRDRIAHGVAPEVDKEWQQYFPEAKLGEKLTIDHIGGTTITQPLPRSEHFKDAHRGNWRNKSTPTGK